MPLENDTGAPVPTNKWGAMLAVGLGILMATLDVSIISVSLPTLVQSLNTNFATIQWVILGYVLALTSLILGVARLGDMYGKRRIFIRGLAVFTTGSLLCGLAPGVGWLIGFRILQGVGAVMTQAVGTAIVTEVFPSEERGRAMGVIGSVVSMGLALGPAIGGILIGLVGWRSVFLVNVPLGLVAGIAALKFIPRDSHGKGDQRFDFPGAVILFLALAAYSLGMTSGQRLGFDSPLVLTMLITGVIGLASFIMVERRSAYPMLEPMLFRNLLFSLNLGMGFLVFTVIAASFILPFYLELVKGFSTAKVGALMMVLPVSMGLVAPGAGMLSDRFGSRGISLLGLLVVIGGCLAISTLSATVDEWGYILRMAVFGVGMGLFQSPNNSAVMGAVPRERLSIAGGLLGLTRTLGHTTGIPLMGAVFSATALRAAGPAGPANATEAPVHALVAGVGTTYHLSAFIILAAATLAAAAFWKARQKGGRLDGRWPKP